MHQYWVDALVPRWIYARSHPFDLLLVKLYIFDSFVFPFWALMIPVLLFPYHLHTAKERVAVFLLVVFLCMIVPLVGFQPHYAAIFIGAFYLRFLHSLTRLWSWRPWDKPAGRALGVLLVGLLIGESCMNLFELRRDDYSQIIGQRAAPFESAYQSVLQALAKQPGRQLILVRYVPGHNPHREWVYNRADIDSAPIVWAREMGSDQDQPFIEYFRDRRVWLLEPDQAPLKLSLYPREASPR